MKAPDKIIVSPHEVFDYDLDIQEVGHNGAEEYIRKGALLEWGKEIAENASWVSIDAVVNKIESL